MILKQEGQFHEIQIGNILAGKSVIVDMQII